MESKLYAVRHDGIVHHTEKALLLRFDDDEVWIPLSQIHNLDEIDVADDSSGIVAIPEWLIASNALEDYVED